MPLLAALTSVFAGGATGLFGAGIQRYFDLKTLKLQLESENRKFEHEIALRKVDAEIMAQEWAARTKVAEVEGAAKVEVADAEAFSASMFKEPERYSDLNFSPAQRWLMVILDFMRGIVRPGLTIYLCAITTAMYLSARALLPDAIPVEDAVAMVLRIQNEILYVTSTVIFWWFGTRYKNKVRS